MTKRSNMEFISIAKGIGIFLVVLGHTIVPQMRQESEIALLLFNFIYSFHMPLFAMLSGYLFEKFIVKYHEQGVKRFTSKKIKSLLLPYLSFSIISYMGIGLCFQIPKMASILSKGGYNAVNPLDAIVQTITHTNHIDKHLWYVYALFFVFLISYLLHSLIKSHWMLIGSFVLYFIFSVYINIPEILYKIVYLLVFFTLARQLTFIDRLTQNKYLIPVLSCFIVFSSLHIFDVLKFSREISFLILFLCAVSGSFLVLIISRMISLKKSFTALNFLGEYSYGIYLIHQPFIVSGITGLLLSSSELPFAVISIITLCLGIGVPVLAMLVINRIKILRLLLLGN